MPMMDSRSRNAKGIYPIELFHYDENNDEFRCPQGKTLSYWRLHRQVGNTYIGQTPRTVGHVRSKSSAPDRPTDR